MKFIKKISNYIKERYVTFACNAILKSRGVPRPTREMMEAGLIDVRGGTLNDFVKENVVFSPLIATESNGFRIDIEHFRADGKTEFFRFNGDVCGGLNDSYDPLRPNDYPRVLHWNVKELEKTGWVTYYNWHPYFWDTDSWNAENEKIIKAHGDAEQFAKRYFKFVESDPITFVIAKTLNPIALLSAAKPLLLGCDKKLKLLEHKEAPKCLTHS